MNANTIAGFIGGTGRNQIPVAAVTTVVETNIPIVTDSGTNGVAVLTVPQPTSVVGSGNPLGPNANSSVLNLNPSLYGIPQGGQAPYFNSGSFDGRPFKIRLAGTTTSATVASQTLAFTLYLGTSKAGTALKGTTAFTGVATAGTYPFDIEALVMWNSASQTVNGTISSTIGSTFVAPAAFTPPTGVTLPNLNFNFSFITAEAGSVSVAVTDFSLDLV